MNRKMFAALVLMLLTLGVAAGCAEEQPVVTDTVASEPVIEEPLGDPMETDTMTEEQWEEAAEELEEAADEAEDEI